MTNVSVCVRFRPLNASEIRQGAKPSCIRRSDEQSFVFKDEKEGEFTFCFDRIYYEDSTQADVFDFLALPIVKDAMNAINGTILTYGQTGAGKTHSMEGPSMITSDQQQKGILPRVVESIFASIEAADATSEFIIKLSMVEIYMERIRDLFNRSKDNLQVKEDKANGIFVSGATELIRENEALTIELRAAERLAVGPTKSTGNPTSISGTAMFQLMDKARIIRPLRGGTQVIQGIDSKESQTKTSGNVSGISILQTIWQKFKSTFLFFTSIFC